MNRVVGIRTGSAWRTALALLQRWYLARPERSREELKEIVKALSVSATADDALLEPVVAAYRALLATHPALAPDVTRDLITWRRWEFAEQMREIRKVIAKRDPLGAYALGLYLGAATGGSPARMIVPSRVETGGATTSDAGEQSVSPNPK